MSWLPWADLPPSSLLMDFSQLDTALVRGPGDTTLRSRLLSSFWTFTRNSAATRVNAAGLIESVAAGVPRIDHDPVSLQPRGLLVEGQRTNLILNSESGSGASSLGAAPLPLDPAVATLGPQLVADPELNNSADWVITDPTTTAIVGGVATFTNSPNNARIRPATDVILEVNRVYRIMCGVTVSAGSVQLILESTPAGANIRLYGTGVALPSSEIFYVIGNGSRISLRTSGVTTATIENLSVVEVTGSQQLSSPSALGPARKITEINTTGAHWIAYSYPCAASTTYTVSVYLKAAERSVVQFFGSANAPGGCLIDLSNGSILNNTVSGLLVAPAGNGWWRVSYQVTTTTTGSTLFYIQLRQGAGGTTTANYTGDGTSGVFVYGPQSEQGGSVSSFIPTGASQVTRLADVPTVIGANFTDWYNQAEGAFAVEYRPTFAAPGQRALSVNDNTANNRIAIDGGLASHLLVTAGGVERANIDAGNPTVAEFNRIAIAYAAGDYAGSLNAAAAVAGGSGALPAVDRLEIGTGNGANPLFGHIRRIQYWPTRLSNAQLQLVSGPQPTSIATASASGSVPLTGTASSLAIAAASALGAMPLEGTAAAVPVASAAATAPLPLEGTALADLIAAAAASAALPLTGSGSAAAVAAARASGVLPLGGAALADLVADAAAIGLIPLEGSAFADLIARADAQGALPLSGSAGLRMFRPAPKIRFTVPVAPRRFTVEASPRRFLVPPAAR